MENNKTAATKPLINVRTWIGSKCATIVDMTNAGKRGKKCATLRFRGYSCTSEDEFGSQAITDSIMYFIEKLTGSESIEQVRAEIERQIVGCPRVFVYPEEMRGIDAPRPTLTAGVEGKWSAYADRDGVTIADLSDRMNDPRCITHDQSRARAYDIAARTWSKVTACATFSEAWTLLSDAGCSLHYYCAMD